MRCVTFTAGPEGWHADPPEGHSGMILLWLTFGEKTDLYGFRQNDQMLMKHMYRAVVV